MANFFDQFDAPQQGAAPLSALERLRQKRAQEATGGDGGGRSTLQTYVTDPLARGYNSATQGAAASAFAGGLIGPEEAAASIVADEKDAAATPIPEDIAKGLKEIQDAKTLAGGALAVLRNPSAAAVVFMESVPAMLGMAAGGLAGGKAGGLIGGAVGSVGGPPGAATGAATGATVGAVVGAGAGSYISEYGASFLDVVRDSGAPLTEDGLTAALKDPAIVAKAREKAVARGVPIAVFDALSFGIAGRLAKPVAKLVGGSARRQAVAAVGAEGAAQAALGAGGEAAAQISSEGSITKPGDVALEGMLELPGMAIELPAAARARGAPAAQSGTPGDAETAATPPLALPPPGPATAGAVVTPPGLSGADSAGAPARRVPISDNARYVYGRLKAAGIGDAQAAGWVGNLIQESGAGLDPTAVGDGGNALGIAQWNGPRKRALESFAAGVGKPATDLGTQVDFLLSELSGSEARAAERISAAADPGTAAIFTSRSFFRPGDPREGNRVAYANSVFEQMTGQSAPATPLDDPTAALRPFQAPRLPAGLDLDASRWLLASGTDPLDIAAMSPAERAASVQEAMDLGVTPMTPQEALDRLAARIDLTLPDDPYLTLGDRASPLPNAVIADGKRALAAGAAELAPRAGGLLGLPAPAMPGAPPLVAPQAMAPGAAQEIVDATGGALAAQRAAGNRAAEGAAAATPAPGGLLGLPAPAMTGVGPFVSPQAMPPGAAQEAADARGAGTPLTQQRDTARALDQQRRMEAPIEAQASGRFAPTQRARAESPVTGGGLLGSAIEPPTADSAAQGVGATAAPPAAGAPTIEAVRQAEAAVDPEPTDAQKEAGNHRKGKLRAYGMDITIETPKGGERRGRAPDGTEWSVTMPAAYGYVRRTKGADGDQVDVYVADSDTASDSAFVIDQYDPKTGKFDEHKTILGVRTREEALRIYDAGFSDGSGPRRRGGVTSLTVGEFRAWATDGDTSKPLSADRPSGESAPTAAAAPAAAPVSSATATAAAGPSGSAAAPSYDEFRAALPKDADGAPDTTAGIRIVKEIAGSDRAFWKDLSPEQKREAIGRARGGEAAPATRAAEKAASAVAAPAPQPDRKIGPDRQPAAPDTMRVPRSVVTPDGMEIDVEYEVVALDSLKAATGDLQPRDRTRKASDEQIAEMASKLDPQQLMPNRKADSGAPIVGPDDMVESGNGRIAGLRRAREVNPAAYGRYLDAVREAGFDAQDGDVLIARRTSDLTLEQRRAFVTGANRASTARMSATELAQVDTDAMTPAVMALFNTALPVNAAGNRQFVTGFLANLPQAERNGLVNADGVLNAEGRRRIDAAIFARAYGDRDMIARMSEADDDAARGALLAMVRAAPKWAAMRAEVDAGDIRPEFDQTRYLLEAVRLVSKARDDAAAQNRPVAQLIAEALNQSDIFTGDVAPSTKAWARAFYATDKFTKPRGVDALADLLSFEVDEIRSAGASGAGLFGDAAQATPEETVNAARGRVERQRDERGTDDFFGGAGGGRVDAGPVPAAAGAGAGGRGGADSGPRSAETGGSPEGEVTPAAAPTGKPTGAAPDSDAATAWWKALPYDDRARELDAIGLNPKRAKGGWGFISKSDRARILASAPEPDEQTFAPVNADGAPTGPTIRVRTLGSDGLTTAERGGPRLLTLYDLKTADAQNSETMMLNGSRQSGKLLPADIELTIEEIRGLGAARFPERGRVGDKRRWFVPSYALRNAIDAREAASPAAFKAQVADLRDRFKAGASLPELRAHPAVKMALAKLGSVVPTEKREGYDSPEWWASREFSFGGDKVVGIEAALPRIVDDFLTLAWREKDMDPQPVATERRAVILLGPPAAGKSTIANEIAVDMRAAIIDSDEIKKLLPEFGDGTTANAVHEESSDIAKLAEGKITAAGANIVYPKVGDSVASIEKLTRRLRDAGYDVELVNMKVTAEEAERRMFGRFGATGRLINPAYVAAVGDKPSETYRALRGSALYSGHGEIDNGQPYGQKPTVTERAGSYQPPPYLRAPPDRERRADPGREGDEPRGPEPRGGSGDQGSVPTERASAVNDASYGASNTFVTKDRAAELRAILKAKLGGSQITAGIDPTILAAGAELAAFHIEAGARQFGAFVRAVADDLGMKPAALRQYARGWYNGARDMMEDAGLDIDGMDDADAVRAAMSTAFEDAPAPAPQETAEGERAVRAAQTITDTFLWSSAPFSNQSLMGALVDVYGGTVAEGAFNAQDAYNALELAINMKIAENPRGDFTPNTDTDDAITASVRLTEMLDRVPTQTRRDGEQIAFQQFSTPPAYAYAVNWIAGIQPGDRVLEPSAGNGGIAVFAKNAGATVHVNEIAERRLPSLRALGFDRVTAENAEQIANLWASEPQYDVVVMNPPFSASGTRGGSNTSATGARHIEQALDRLRPGGRLVAIMGHTFTPSNGRVRDFFDRVGRENDIRALVTVDGKSIYRKYGTGYDSVVLVIDKRPPSGAQPVGGKADSVLALIRMMEGIAGEQRARPDTGASPDGARGPQGRGPDGARPDGNERPPERQPAPEPDPLRGPGRDDAGAGGRGGGARGPSGRGGASGGGGGGGARSGASGRAGASQRPAGGQPRNGGVGGDRPAAAADFGEVGELVVLDAETGAPLATDTGTFASYRPSRITIEGAPAHPAKLVEASAMASVRAPRPTYRPQLPKAMMDAGHISEPSLEQIVYAGQAHSEMLPGETKDGKKVRRGYFIGDGTGVGKTRQIAGIVMDNWTRGRRKAVLLSKDKNLAKDARAEFDAIGMAGIPIADLGGTTKPNAKIELGDGVLFTTYSTLGRATAPGEKSRVQQIADWLGPDFDGLILFDEAHQMANALPIKKKRGFSQPSLQALQGLELQRKLPNARVVYASATGATEVHNLAYAERLGLWGEGTPFDNVQEFVTEIDRGGLASMEVVARDMKQMGLYLARTISFEGVEYDRATQTLTPDQREMYDVAAKAWQGVLRNINAVIGVGKDKDQAPGKGDKNLKAAALAQFWGTHQRFFNQVLTAMQMPAMFQQIEKDLAEGRAPVIQMTSTNEAATARALGKLTDEDTLEDVDITPTQMLMDYVKNSFPIYEYEIVTDSEGKKSTQLVTDSEGKPVVSKMALAKRDALMAELASIRLPGNPLDMIIDRFGVDRVAEVTGRSSRIVTRKGKRVVERWSKIKGKADAEAFQDGKRDVLVFSQAGGTGASYHADKRVKNQKRRAHYVLQSGWSAAVAMQGLGRSHRSNQVMPPVYRLVSTDTAGSRRFVATIARRLDQLGALTKGQQDAGGGGLFSAADNLETVYAEGAVHGLITDAYYGRLPGIGFDDLVAEMGLNLISAQTGGLDMSKIPAVPQFLNRILSLTIERQNQVFDAFMQRMEGSIAYAVSQGQYNTGVQKIEHLGATEEARQTVYEKGEIKTEYVRIKTQHRNLRMSFENVKEGTFRLSRATGRIYSFTPTSSITLPDGTVETAHIRRGVDGSYERVPASVMNRDYSYLPKSDDPDVKKADQARQIWNDELANLPEKYAATTHMVTGALLPVWNRLGVADPVIKKIELDDGTSMLGREISRGAVNDVLKALGVGVEPIRMEPAEVQRTVLDGMKVTFSSGHSLVRRRVGGEPRIEVYSPGDKDWSDKRPGGLLSNLGMRLEQISYQMRAFVPTGPAGETPLRRFMQGKDIIDVSEGIQREQRAAPAAAPLTAPQIEALRASLSARVGERVALRIERALSDMARSPGAYTQAADGSDAAVILRFAADPEATLGHEVIHAAKNLGLFTDEEWTILANRARSRWLREMADHVSLYAQDGEAIQIEEAVAEAYARGYGRRATEPMSVRRLLQRLGDMIEALGNWRRGLGLQSARGILEALDRGEMAGRETRAGGAREVTRNQAVTQRRRFGVPPAAGRPISAFAKADDIKAHPDYRAAKAGDVDAAVRLVRDMTPAAMLQEAADRFGPGAVYAPVIAEEATGRNKLPEALAQLLASASSGDTTDAIAQTTRAFHTGVRPMDRLLARALFDGDVEAGRRYVLVDDVSVLGGTLAELANHIRSNGGEVVGVVVLANASRSGDMPVRPAYARMIDGRFGDVLRSELSVEPEALTADEARYLLGFRDADALRAGIAKGRSERNARLDAKGIFGRDASDLGGSGVDEQSARVTRERRTAPPVTGPTPFDSYEEVTAHAFREAFAPRNWKALAEAETWGDIKAVLMRSFVDRLDPLRRQIAAVERARGAIPLSEHTWKVASLFEGRAADRMEKLHRDFVKPIAQKMRTAGFSRERVDDFLAARHALERNRQIASLYAVDDPQHQFVRALTDPTVVGGSGMSINDARAILRQERGQAAMQDIGAMFDAMMQAKQAAEVAAGLKSQEQADAEAATYKHYAPLRGFENEEADGGPGTGQGFGVGGGDKRAMGRRSRSDSPLAYGIEAASRAIVRSEKNRVFKSLLRLVQNNPDARTWKIHRAKDMSRAARAAGRAEGFDDMAMGIGDRVKRMGSRRVIDPTTGLPVSVPQVNEGWQPPSRFADNVVSGRIGGEEVYVEFENADLGRAWKALDAESSSTFVRVLGTATRLLSALSTRFNPDFFIPNIARDLTAAGIQIGDEKVRGVAMQIVKDWPKAFRGALQHERGTGSHPWKAIADEFAEQGGKVNYMDFRGVEDLKDWLQGEVDPGTLRKLGEKASTVTDVIAAMTSAGENAVRVATYKAMRDAGMSKARAAMVAREITVNFNRKGNLGPAMNALFMFFNAAVQGTYRTAQSLAVSKYARGAAAGLVGVGFMEAMLGAAGDDDEYEKVNQYIRDRNIVIMLGPLGLGDGGEHVKVPLPYGYNVFKVIGSEVGRLLNGKEGPGDAAGNVMAAALTAFLPIQQLWPTVITPFVEIGFNENFFGGSIRPSDFDGMKPRSEQYFPGSVSEGTVAFTRWLNEATGGNTFRDGFLSVSPADIEHIGEFVTGGLGRFLMRGLRTGETIVDGRLPDMEDTPIVRAVWGRTFGEAPTRRAYRDLSERAVALDYEINGLQKSGRAAEARAARDRDPFLTSIIGRTKADEKRLAGIRADEKRIRASAMSEARRQTELDRVRDQRNAIMRDYLEWTGQRLKASRPAA